MKTPKVVRKLGSASFPLGKPTWPTSVERPGPKRRVGLDYDTARIIAALPEIVELNIGHFLVGEAIFVGLAETVRKMRQAMDEGRGWA